MKSNSMQKAIDTGIGGSVSVISRLMRRGPQVDRQKVIGQSKRLSLAEVLVSTGLGFFLAYIINKAFLKHYDCQVGTGAISLLVVTMTVVSIIRQYVIRRGFNYYATRSNNSPTQPSV